MAAVALVVSIVAVVTTIVAALAALPLIIRLLCSQSQHELEPSMQGTQMSNGGGARLGKKS